MIVTEGGGTIGGATRRCFSGAEFAAASRGTRRSSVQGRVLLTTLLGRHYVSSGARTFRRFPFREGGWGSLRFDTTGIMKL